MLHLPPSLPPLHSGRTQAQTPADRNGTAFCGVGGPMELFKSASKSDVEYHGDDGLDAELMLRCGTKLK